jgi:hypothetical protein
MYLAISLFLVQEDTNIFELAEPAAVLRVGGNKSIVGDMASYHKSCLI